MRELEKTVEQLKSEGYTSDDIQKALSKMKEDTLKEPEITGSLDDYINTFE